MKPGNIESILAQVRETYEAGYAQGYKQACNDAINLLDKRSLELVRLSLTILRDS